jgi:hypothetical protein
MAGENGLNIRLFFATNYTNCHEFLGQQAQFFPCEFLIIFVALTFSLLSSSPL